MKRIQNENGMKQEIKNKRQQIPEEWKSNKKINKMKNVTKIDEDKIRRVNTKLKSAQSTGS
jgi:hypothetical protein